MSPKFELSIDSITIANTLPGIWSPEECLQLLKALEFEDADGIQAENLREYAVMALQDLEPAEAAAALIDITLGKRLTDGKKQNVSEEMTSDRLWEEYPDLSCHERIFKAQVLLYAAFPETPQPEINKVTATLSSLNQAAEAYLRDHAANAVPEALIVRCIASAIPEDAILVRLFEDQIKEGAFAEAEQLVWHIQSETIPGEGPRRERRKLSLYSPIRWSGGLEEESVVECEPFIPETD